MFVLLWQVCFPTEDKSCSIVHFDSAQLVQSFCNCLVRLRGCINFN